MNGMAPFAFRPVEAALGVAPAGKAAPLTMPGCRVIVDLSDLVPRLGGSQGMTGIPRVVYEFANAAAALAPQHGLTLLYGYFDETRGRFIRLTDPSAPGDSDGRLFDASVFPPSNKRPINIPKIQAKYAGKPLKQHLHIAKGRLRLAGRRMIHGLQARASSGSGEPVEFRQGDVLLMLGSGWYALPLFDHITPFAKRGLLKPVVLVHDLIPLLKFEEGTTLPVNIFECWLELAADLTRHFITYSHCTREDLLAYFDAAGRPRPDVDVIPLAHELAPAQPSPLSPQVRDLIASNYALFVGPVGGRKNARRLLEAWRIVLSRLGPKATPILAVTDRSGAERIEATHIRPAASHLRLLDRPSDYELSVLYRRAAFTVFPSLYEGWGLPVGESLWHGTPCITSNISAMPEVGGALCDYVDPLNVDSIAAAVERYVRDDEYRNRRASQIQHVELRSWKRFSQDILNKIKDY